MTGSSTSTGSTSDGPTSTGSTSDGTSIGAVVAASQVVVCCGSGGVGKTTTAAVIALEAARQGRRAVVVTIDPARRLADALGLEGLTNTPARIDASGIDAAGTEGSGAEGSGRDSLWDGELWAMMLDTKATFDGLVRRYSADAAQAERILGNTFYENISGSLSGTQEYMASEKLYELAVEGDYDLVVVDTPPTRNALDFIEAPQRLAHFLDHRLYRVLVAPTRGIVKAVNVAAQTLVRSLSKVVGSDVIADALDFFAAFDGMEAGFKERARRVDELLGAASTAFVLVASPKADTVTEAGYFADKLHDAGIDVRALVVNRMQPTFAGPAGAGPDSSPASLRTRAEELAGTALADHYTALADSRVLAEGEHDHLTGLRSRVAPAPVAELAVQPFEVTDLTSLSRLADLLFEGRER
ncbi:MAG: AAA family ATPase [Actinomycetota bacterium]|nr:AAA family ATPase [Actinomycetota bacterium]